MSSSLTDKHFRTSTISMRMRIGKAAPKREAETLSQRSRNVMLRLKTKKQNKANKQTNKEVENRQM
jgi:hypothetical protein